MFGVKWSDTLTDLKGKIKTQWNIDEEKQDLSVVQYACGAIDILESEAWVGLDRLKGFLGPNAILHLFEHV